jgi:hypothetical protein
MLRVSALQREAAAGGNGAAARLRMPHAIFVPPGYTNMLLAHVVTEGDCHAGTQLFQSFRTFVLSAFPQLAEEARLAAEARSSRAAWLDDPTAGQAAPHHISKAEVLSVISSLRARDDAGGAVLRALQDGVTFASAATMADHRQRLESALHEPFTRFDIVRRVQAYYPAAQAGLQISRCIECHNFPIGNQSDAVSDFRLFHVMRGEHN